MNEGLGQNGSNACGLPQLRIAVTGSAGIGKSTLSRDLAQSFGLPLVNECYDDLFDPPALFRDAGAPLADAVEKLFERKKDLEERYKVFVTDRFPIDLMHLWMYKKLTFDRTRTGIFFRRCREHLVHYDFVVIPPWGVLPIVDTGHAQRKRSPDPLIQMKNHATLVGYCHMFIPKGRIIEIPDSIRERVARVEFVKTVISKRHNAFRS